MVNIYDDNLKSLHGPSGQKQQSRGPWGGKDNTKNASAQFSEEKKINTRPKQ